MKRNGEAWFSFGGVRCVEMGLRMEKTPVISSAARRGERAQVPGRDGGIWLDGGGYEDVRIKVECLSTEGFDEENARKWLGGAGLLVFSDAQDRAYRARADEGASFSAVREGYDGKRVQAEFVCEPFRYAWPEEQDAVLTAAGEVDNPGNVQSLPRIEVEADGDFALMVNGQLMEVKGGSVVIDSELRDCLSPDGLLLANERVTLTEFPQLRPGANAVSWTGNVTKVTIARRVRYL